ncbi:MAG: PpiC-type peptidyl-prolyl cis-trans isomerase [Gammaproteobacteria bacterium]|nr:PpiC-type peptidyl-prolyl cis-trans isomerase [Gammaproteobacteria bacterium]
MLQTIHGWASGWLATVVFGLLIIPFAFWGINYYFDGGEEPVVAKVNDEEIKLSQFQRAFDNYRLQMQSLMGQNLGPAEEGILKQQVLGRLIESELLNQVTQSAGLRVSDDQVRETIKNIELFKGEEGFKKDLYEQSVLQLGMPPALFEQQMRLEMASEQLQSAIVESAFVSKNETEYAARLKNQKRDLYYTILSADKFKESIEVSDEDVESYYKNNDKLYVKPEEVKIAYIELSLNQLADEVEVNEEALGDYYEANKANYDVDEQRKISQILIKTDENAAAESVEKAKTKANDILQLVNSGKTFEDIAKQYAEDTDPNFSISDHDFLSKGILPEEVDAVAFSMQKDQVSDVVQSKSGFHILKLHDIKGGVANTFENAREAVEKDYRHAKGEERFFDLSDKLATLTYEHPDTLEIAAEETGTNIQHSEFFSRNGSTEGLTADPKIQSASFSEDVLINGHNSEMIELDDNRVVVLRDEDHNAEARRPLDEVRDNVIEDIRFTRASEKTHAKGQEILAQLHEGKSFEAVATEADVEWQHSVDITREDVTVNRAVLRTAFNLGKPQDNKPVFGGAAMGTGDYAVIAVLKAENPEPDAIDKEKISELKSQLQRSRAMNSWGEVLQELQNKAEIKIFPDKI